MSTLTGPALAASKAALSAAMNEIPDPSPNDEDLGEVQEVDMQTQAETIRTVFSDPTNFNVKVRARLYLLSSDNVAI
jgi:translation initiation factor 4E